MDRREFLSISLALPVIGALSKEVFATTWGEQEVKCPICETKNTFLSVMSYGSYIYSWPSKYQLIYWPVTDSPSVYCCKKCHLSMFMWDFTDLAKDKIPPVKKLLETVSLNGTFEKYTDIPMSERLGIAEKVYGVLGKENSFWCWFNRIVGYHYAAEKNAAKADEARKKALNLAKKMLDDKDGAVATKELLVICGAMKHFLKDDDGAIVDLNKALTVKYINPKLDAEKNNNAEQNLNELIKDYVERIKSPKPPRDDPGTA